MRAAVVFLLLCGTARAGEPPKIVDKPIAFDEERVELTLAYRKAHEAEDIDTIEIKPRMIVLHYTGGKSFKSTWSYFNKTKIEGAREKLAKASALNVSAQFVVDRDGTIYRLMPETRMARHTIGLNGVAIGVENVGDGDKTPLTEAQVEADAALIRYLAGKYDITHVIGHSEYRRMEGHPYFQERDPKYRNEKPDPGNAFLKKVRAKIADLKLEGAPEAKKR